MNKVIAIILAGGMGNRLSILAEERAKPAVIFAGKYRIIDFVLSNCVNSGIYKVGVLTQYRPRSLNDHIGIGKPWDLDRIHGGVNLLQPYQGRGHSDWYKGNADAVCQNLYYIEESDGEDIVILAGDHIYKMNYDSIISFHRHKKADVTVGVVEVAPEDSSRFGILTLDRTDRVIEFQEKPLQPKSHLGSMGIYVFRREPLATVLAEDYARKGSTHDFGRDIITSMLDTCRVYGFRYKGYWRDIGTIDSYFQTSMEFLDEPPPIDFSGRGGIIRTRSQDRPPVRIGLAAQVERSLLCNGCTVHGEVRRSILSPGVRIEEGARVEDSILFDDVHVARGAIVRRAIIDKEVAIGRQSFVGFSDDSTPNQEEPANLRSGITLVGKRARVPAKAKIGHNCIIDPAVVEQDYPGLAVASGQCVRHRLENPVLVS
ncbi:MAG: glucose-1-phosphate adenylyltransferase [Chloroflexi bacterium]|nr:glucose-1-phosphate adenylyltransferase [Chloroflexota bacterium]